MALFASCLPTAPTVSADSFCRGFAGCGNPDGMRPTAENLNAVLYQMAVESANENLALSVAGNTLTLSANGANLSSVTLPSGGGTGGDPVGVVPVGGIILWSGPSNAVPAGFALCDGNRGTPNLIDRFVVGAGGGYAVGQTGGSATHTHTGLGAPHALTVAEMPLHNHGNGVCDNGSFSNLFNHGQTPAIPATGGSIDNNGDRGTIEGLTTSVGQGLPHEHNITMDAADGRPPYYALAYIMRL